MQHQNRQIKLFKPKDRNRKALSKRFIEVDRNQREKNKVK